jgi:protein tyrosine phosphatase type 4A
MSFKHKISQPRYPRNDNESLQHTPSMNGTSFNSTFSATNALGTKLPNPPSYLHFGRLKFIIMDAPTDDNLFLYIKELEEKSVSLIVRTCEPTYSSDSKLLEKHKITVIDLPFPDGHPPSLEIMDEWLSIVEEQSKHGRPIAVHCVAGLGRAPVLVAIALMEKQQMEANAAISLIRECRRGAINQKQYEYLKQYQNHKKHECCVLL